MEREKEGERERGREREGRWRERERGRKGEIFGVSRISFKKLPSLSQVFSLK